MESQLCTSAYLHSRRVDDTQVDDVALSPSEDNVDGFVERGRLEREQFIGPRIFQVGNIIYGAGAGVHQDIADSAEAYSALVRIKVEGGPVGISYKNYNLPSRYVVSLTPNLCMEDADWFTLEHPVRDYY